jgi:flagellar biosynthesis GTPase FlhF
MEGGLLSLHSLNLVSPPPNAAGPTPGSEVPQVPPELPATTPSWPGLDRLGITQAIGGLALGLIALFSSYDHLTVAGRNIPIPQQWGIPLIAASVAIVFVDAQLASRSRLRAAEDAARAADETTRERHLASEERQRAEQRENEADRERNRADQERNRAAEADERQRKSLERLHQTAVLSARVQLDPSGTNRARLQTFLALLNQTPEADSDL